ncbi:MAG: tetratricopeptide repeat protein [Pseudomonadales bacterium]|nr:tetratricopeptide repeat protein [Pseudomonadales bacterium]
MRKWLQGVLWGVVLALAGCAVQQAPVTQRGPAPAKITSGAQLPSPIISPEVHQHRPVPAPPVSQPTTPAPPVAPAYTWASQPQVRLADGSTIPVLASLLKRAQTYQYQGKWYKAAHVLEQAVRVAPQSALPYLRFGQLRLAQKQYASAANMARRGLLFARLAQDRGQLWQVIAQAYRAQGQLTLARQAEAESQRALKP